MGNGSRLKPDPNSVVGSYGDPVTIDLGGGMLTEDDLEKVVQASLNNFGRPSNPLIFMPPAFFSGGWETHPEYRGTPWSTKDRLTKREHKVAAVHTLLKKLKVLKSLSDEDLVDIKNLTVKRLKRAKWAQNAGKKV